MSKALELGHHLILPVFCGQVILDKNSPKIRSVVNKLNAIQNKFRTMELEVLAGDTSLLTTAIEHGMLYEIDLSLV